MYRLILVLDMFFKLFLWVPDKSICTQSLFENFDFYSTDRLNTGKVHYKRLYLLVYLLQYKFQDPFGGLIGTSSRKHQMVSRNMVSNLCYAMY